jgi:isocitrate dehydrogenase (NAD+)
VPGANIGDRAAVFEAVHGSAPDIAGRNLANPLALLMSAVMMLNHLAETRDAEACATAAQRIKEGYNKALAEGSKTRDLGGRLGTAEFADAIIRHIDRQPSP